MKAIEAFETSRLILRAPKTSDAESIFKNYATDPEVTKFLMWRPHKTIEDTYDFIKFCENGWANKTNFTWAITLKGSNHPIGMFSARNDKFKTDIGYVLAKRYWGQGLMPEAGSAFIQWALKDDDVFRVWAFCDSENLASAKVLEKMGLQREAYLKRWSVHPNISSAPRDCISYALTR